MYNTNAINLEQEIIKLINESQLHVATIKLIMDKLSKTVNEILQKELESEANQMQASDLVDIEQDIAIDQQ